MSKRKRDYCKKFIKILSAQRPLLLVAVEKGRGEHKKKAQTKQTQGV